MLKDLGAGIIRKSFPVHWLHFVALAVWIGGVVLRDLKSMLRTQSKAIPESAFFRGKLLIVSPRQESSHSSMVMQQLCENARRNSSGPCLGVEKC